MRAEDENEVKNEDEEGNPSPQSIIFRKKTESNANDST
jgi:hypothetical protein